MSTLSLQERQRLLAKLLATAALRSVRERAPPPGCAPVQQPSISSGDDTSDVSHKAPNKVTPASP